MSARTALGVGLALLAALALSALAGPWLAGADPLRVDMRAVLSPPSADHPLGTDGLGRDVLARLVHGARPSLAGGLLATGVAGAIGILAGLAAGMGPRLVDGLLSRAADTVYAVPAVLGSLAVLGLAGRAADAWPPALRVGLAIGLFAWPPLFRYVRAEVRRWRNGEVALAAVAIGAGPWRVALRHVLPQALPPVLVPLSFLAGGAVLVEAGLGFFGLGVPPPWPSWGNLLLDGMHHVASAWWLTVFPGACVFLTVLACHLVGEGLSGRP